MSMQSHILENPSLTIPLSASIIGCEQSDESVTSSSAYRKSPSHPEQVGITHALVQGELQLSPEGRKQYC